MGVFPVILLAVVQGITEFLPVSSSAHLILISSLMHQDEQGAVFAIALHLGTLIAVLYYFRRELHLLIKDWVLSCLGRGQTPYSRLAWTLGLSVIPAGLAGLLFNSYISLYLREPPVIALALMLFALFLGFADYRGRKTRDEYSLTWKEGLLIGLAQAIALIPGASRLGTTITAGLLLGLSRKASVRFSFLMSIPVILMAVGYESSQLTATQWAQTSFSLLALGIGICAITGLLCIHIFVKIIERIGMMPFVIYRLLLGSVILVLFW